MFGWMKKNKPGDSGSTAVQEKTKAEPKKVVGEPTAPKPPEPSVRGEAKVKVLDRKGCRVTMSVTVPVDRVGAIVEKSFEDVRAVVKWPGYRAGKVPLDVVKNKFSAEAWHNAEDRLVRWGIQAALLHEQWMAVCPPSVDKLEGAIGKPFSFEFSVDIAPTFKPKNYKGLTLTKTPRPVTDEDIDKKLEEIRQSHARLVHSDKGAVENHHFVTVDYDCFLGSQPVKNGSSSQQLIDMGAPQMVEGFTAGLLGAKEGESRDIPVVFPASHPQKDLAGKTVTFKTTVTDIKDKILPPLDDEFAKDVGAAALADLKETLRKNLESDRVRAEREDLEKQAKDGLLKENPIDVPGSLVDEEAQSMTERLKEFLVSRGANVSDWEANKSSLLEKNRPEAERRVRLLYVMAHIMREENITVSDDEVATEITSMVEQASASQRHEVKNLLAGRREAVRERMREDRFFDFLIKNAKVSGAEGAV